jgi:hypothetical protein
MKWLFRSSSHETPRDAGGVRLPAGAVGTFISFGPDGFEYRETRQDLASDGFIRTASTHELAQRAPEAVVHDIEERLRRPNIFAWYVGGSVFLALWAASLHPVVSILLLTLAAVPARRIYVWNRARRRPSCSTTSRIRVSWSESRWRRTPVVRSARRPVFGTFTTPSALRTGSATLAPIP